MITNEFALCLISSVYVISNFLVQEVEINKKADQKLGMVIKGGLQGQPGNPNDPSDEGVFISKINEGGCIFKEYSDNLKV